MFLHKGYYATEEDMKKYAAEVEKYRQNPPPTKVYDDKY